MRIAYTLAELHCNGRVTPLTISDGSVSISSVPILEEDQDTVAEMFEAMSDPDPDLDSELDPDSEPELPAHVINRKVS